MKTAARLQQLRLAIHGISAPFSCAGSCVPKNPIALRLKNRKRFVIEKAEDARKQESALQPLIDCCQPATFGDNRRNRFDRRVRDAVQLKAESGEFAVENFDPESAGIVDAILREMFPPGSPPVRAELYALNLYTPGGHFAPHKDTPRGNDMFGTLVVCLPSIFCRGQLTLTQGGVVQQFDWGADISRQQQASQIHWAAFFGDVDHQIGWVSLGVRVTLTYLLRRADTSLPSRTLDTKDLAPAVQSALHGLLADASFLPKGGLVGYPCCHLYHQDARFQIQQKALNRRSVNMLKGRDQLVAAAALQAGLDVTFTPYLYENCVNETWQLDRFPTNEEKRKLKARMDLRALESALPIAGKSAEKAGGFGVTWLDQPPPSTGRPNDGGRDGDSQFPVAAPLHSCEYCEWGYFGNEASDVDFYIYAALHIRIPPLGRGPRANLAAAVSMNRKGVEKARTVKKKASATKKSTVEPRKRTAKRPRKKSP